jgi:Cofactor assembly of complex C subunit B, CCB2/CCB4
MAKPDQNQVIRQLPIAVGTLAGILLLTNRVLTPNLSNWQARSDALGIIMSAVLILTGLLWQQVQPKLPDAVTLVGEEGFEWRVELPERLKAELAWASHILLTNTVTQSLIIYYQGQILLRRGILATQRDLKPGAIVQRVLDRGKPIYLVDVKAYPGRIEFDYLPENTQGIICQPLGTAGLLILAANAPRSYTQQDETWIAAIAEKLTYSLTQDFPQDLLQAQSSIDPTDGNPSQPNPAKIH